MESSGNHGLIVAEREIQRYYREREIESLRVDEAWAVFTWRNANSDAATWLYEAGCIIHGYEGIDGDARDLLMECIDALWDQVDT